jgi:hypothetical protein
MKAQGKFVNSSLGGTDSARASLTMFSRATFRSPSLNPADIVAMQPSSFSQFLLRVPALVAELSQ